MHHSRRDTGVALRARAMETYDPFAVNPLRRSAIALLVSSALVIGPPALLSPSTADLVLITVGWIAMAVMVLSLPVLLMSLIELLWKRVTTRLRPSVDELELSERTRNLLRRHGFTTIASIDQTSDSSLLVLSNFDARAMHEVRRAISIWRYRRWQEAGFPDRGLRT